MDLTRLREEVLVPAQTGAAVHSQAYSCREGAYLPEQCVPPAPLYILEGSYSHHPILAGFYDLKVFVTCSKEEQARRLQAGRRTLRKFCPSVDSSGRGLLCAVPHRSAGRPPLGYYKFMKFLKICGDFSRQPVGIMV